MPRNSKRMIMCSSSAGRVNKWLCYVTSLCPLSLNTTKVAPGYKYIQKILEGHPILQKHLSILIIFRLLFCGFIFLQIRNWQIKHFVGLCIGVTSHSPVESTWKSSASLKAEGKSKFLRPQSWSFSKQVSRQQGLSHPQATFGNLVIFNDMKSLSEHFKFMTTVLLLWKCCKSIMLYKIKCVLWVHEALYSISFSMPLYILLLCTDVLQGRLSLYKLLRLVCDLQYK